MDTQLARAVRVTMVAFGINVCMVIFKIMAGIFGHSSAIVADAVHSFSDLSTDVLTLWGVLVARKPIDKCHAYGHGKVETLVTLLIGLVLIAVGIKIFLGGGSEIYRYWQGAPLSSPGWIAFYAALFSIVTKEWLYRFSVKIGGEMNSPALIANAWHHRSDALSSLGVLIGIGGAIVLGERGRILDPLAAMIVCVFIVHAGVIIFKNSALELVETSLDKKEEERILDVIARVPGVVDPHKLKTRKVGNKIVIDVHIKVDDSLNIVEAHDISSHVESRLKEFLGGETMVSVHTEPLRHHGQEKREE